MTPLRPSERVRRAALPVALCTGLAVALTACADPDKGTNGVGKLSATEIEHRAQTAVNGATAVRLTGALVTRGQTYKLDMRLKKSGAMGSVTAKTSTFELLRVDDALFLKASAGFWDQASGGAGPTPGESSGEVADKLGDKYVKVPENDPSYKQLRGFTDMHALLDGLLTLGGAPAKGDRGRIGGSRTIEVSGGADGKGGTLDVSLDGTPFPLRLVRGGGAGTLTLEDWGKDFTLKAPTKDQMVDYGSKIPKT